MNILYYFINLILSLQFILMGIYLVLLHFYPEAAEVMGSLIDGKSLLGTYLGVFFIVIGLGIFVYFMNHFKKRTYYIRKGKVPIEIDEKIFNSYLTEYLSELFPNQEASHQLICRKKKLSLSIEIPYLPKAEQENITERIFDDIQDLLSEKIGYRDEISLTVVFQSPSVELSS